MHPDILVSGSGDMVDIFSYGETNMVLEEEDMKVPEWFWKSSANEPWRLLFLVVGLVIVVTLLEGGASWGLIGVVVLLSSIPLLSAVMYGIVQNRRRSAHTEE